MDGQICPIDPWANRTSCHSDTGRQVAKKSTPISRFLPKDISKWPGFWWLEFRWLQYFTTSTAANITEWRRAVDVLPLGPGTGSIHLRWPSHLSKMFGLFSFQFFVPPQNTQTIMEKTCLSTNFPSRQPFSIEISTKNHFKTPPPKIKESCPWRFTGNDTGSPGDFHLPGAKFFLNPIFLDPILGVCGMCGQFLFKKHNNLPRFKKKRGARLLPVFFCRFFFCWLYLYVMSCPLFCVRVVFLVGGFWDNKNWMDWLHLILKKAIHKHQPLRFPSFSWKNG